MHLKSPQPTLVGMAVADEHRSFFGQWHVLSTMPKFASYCAPPSAASPHAPRPKIRMDAEGGGFSLLPFYLCRAPHVYKESVLRGGKSVGVGVGFGKVDRVFFVKPFFWGKGMENCRCALSY